MKQFRRLGTPQKGFLISKQTIENLFKPPKEYEKKDTEIGIDIEASKNVDSRVTRRNGYNEDLFI